MRLLTPYEVLHSERRLSPCDAPPGFHRLTPGCLSAQAAPLLSIPDARLEPWAPDWHRRREYVHDLGCYVLEDICIDRDGYLFAGTEAVYQPDIVVPYIRDFIVRRGQTERPIEATIEEPVLVAFDRGHATYGHVLLDTLARVQVASRLFGPRLGEARLLVPPHAAEWMLGMLNVAVAGQPIRRMEAASPTALTRLRRAIVPTHVHHHYHFHPLARDFFAALLANLGPGNSPISDAPIWITRTGVRHSSRVAEGIEAAEAHARAAGFEVLAPESMPWPDQVRRFASTRLIAGEYGSALHNVAFAPNGVTTLAFGRLQFLQSFLGALNGQRLAYLMPDETGTRDGVAWSRFSPDRARAAIDAVLAASRR
jgi:hypothetical protein